MNMDLFLREIGTVQVYAVFNSLGITVDRKEHNEKYTGNFLHRV
jgi:hypothetical protein